MISRRHPSLPLRVCVTDHPQIRNGIRCWWVRRYSNADGLVAVCIVPEAALIPLTPVGAELRMGRA